MLDVSIVQLQLSNSGSVRRANPSGWPWLAIQLRMRPFHCAKIGNRYVISTLVAREQCFVNVNDSETQNSFTMSSFFSSSLGEYSTVQNYTDILVLGFSRNLSWSFDYSNRTEHMNTNSLSINDKDQRNCGVEYFAPTLPTHQKNATSSAKSVVIISILDLHWYNYLLSIFSCHHQYAFSFTKPYLHLVLQFVFSVGESRWKYTQNEGNRKVIRRTCMARTARLIISHSYHTEGANKKIGFIILDCRNDGKPGGDATAVLTRSGWNRRDRYWTPQWSSQKTNWPNLAEMSLLSDSYSRMVAVSNPSPTRMSPRIQTCTDARFEDWSANLSRENAFQELPPKFCQLLKPV